MAPAPERLLALLAALFAADDPAPQAARQDAPGGRPQEVVEVAPVPVPAPHEDAFGTRAIRTESVTDRRFLLEQQVRTLPDALKELPAIGLQRTGPGQTSPFLRGWTGFRTLYVLDGFRFNHSAWREGPNQYFATVDLHRIDHVDVRYGSGSVRYGSDAIGGTVVMETEPAGSSIPGREWSARFETRLASAERSAIVHASAGGDLPEGVAWSFGLTGSSFGDVNGGRHVGEQQGTAYDATAADVKLAWRLGARSEIVLAHQQDDVHDAPRTHSTVDGISWHGTTVGTDLEREFDQMRDFTYARLDWREGGTFERVRAGLGYHSQDEDETRVRSNSNRTEQGFDVDTLGAYLNFERPTPFGRIRFGADHYHDSVNSYQRNYDPSGALTSVGIQGPVGDDATYDASGLFVEDELGLGGGFTVTAGARGGFARADADSVRDAATGSPITVDDDWWSWAADLRLRKDWSEEHATWIGASRAIRVPNLSDLTRFDLALSGEIETPSPGLDPEEFTTIEVGGEHRFGAVEARAAVYVTFIDDMIVRFPTGNVVAGANEIQKANVGDGRMQGVDVAASWRFHPDWRIGADVSYVAGRVETFLAPGVEDEEPLAKLPPLHGSVRLRWDDPGTTWWVEGVAAWADRQDRLSPLDELDTQRIPPDGTPGYLVVGVRLGLRPTERLDVAVAVENVTDRDWRLHGSGVNEPGTNAILTVRYRI